MGNLMREVVRACPLLRCYRTSFSIRIYSLSVGPQKEKGKQHRGACAPVSAQGFAPSIAPGLRQLERIAIANQSGRARGEKHQWVKGKKKSMMVEACKI